MDGAIEVAVRLNAGLADRLGTHCRIALPQGSTVADLLVALAADAGVPIDGATVRLDGRLARRAAPIRDGGQASVVITGV